MVDNEIENVSGNFSTWYKVGDTFSWLATQCHVSLTNNFMDLFDRVLEFTIWLQIFSTLFFVKRILSGQNLVANS